MKTATRIQRAEVTNQKSGSRITPPRNAALRAKRAFTLIELLAVIAVIGVLAGLSFPAIRAAKLSILRARAKAELTQVESVIERFQQKLGYYPPDNPTNWPLNQLYYELLGTTNIGTVAAPVYLTLDGSAQINGANLPTTFGFAVTGFVNCTRPGKGDDVAGAIPFVKSLKPSQFLLTTLPGNPTVLGSTIEGPLMYLSAAGGKLNPWRYNSSSPRYSTKSYDLWIDVTAGDKTNRICNWSDKPLVVGAPY